jgi:hypothetical protein
MGRGMGTYWVGVFFFMMTWYGLFLWGFDAFSAGGVLNIFVDV